LILNNKRIIIILIVGIFLVGTISLIEIEKQNKKYSDLTNNYESLMKDYDLLQLEYEYVLEMMKICEDDPMLCQEIKNAIKESKNDKKA